MDIQRPSPGRACTLHLYTQDRFDPEIEALRRSDFELAAGTTRVRDAFDDCSTYCSPASATSWWAPCA